MRGPALAAPSTEMTPEPKRAASPAELNALVGAYITRETPETFWEDSHGHFQFTTEIEARRAIADPYYQRFLPDVDWNATVIREVRHYRPYCGDADASWALVEIASTRFGALRIWREGGRWRAAFGDGPDADARVPAVAICLAALTAAGVVVEVLHDRIDSHFKSAEPHGSNGFAAARG